MNSTKAKLFFAEYRRGTLDAKTCAKICELLESDAELSAAYKMDGRLQNLIALKRYETPKPEQFDTFLAEFHRRQRLELAKTESVWTRIHETAQSYLFNPTSAMLHYGGVAALLAIVVGMSFFYSPRHATITAQSASHAFSPYDSPIANVSVVLANNNVTDAPVNYVLQRVNYSTGQNGFTQFNF